MAYREVMMNYVRLVVAVAALVMLVSSWAHAQMEYRQLYVRKQRTILHGEPHLKASQIGTLAQNESLVCLEERKGWVRVSKAGRTSGWVRSNHVSDVLVRIHKNDQTLSVYKGDEVVLVLPIKPGPKGIGQGRYFGTLQGRSLLLSWPNRQDLRKYLETGQISHSTYERGIIGDLQVFDGIGLSLCASGSKGKECGVFVAKGDFSRLAGLAAGGVRVEIYADSVADKIINEPDGFSFRVYQGALKQLESPAAGIASNGRAPSMSYPGGDIQPDFAAASDIVIRAVREAGIDLQAAVYEDMLLSPRHYAGLDMGVNDFGAHRMVPVLHAFFSRLLISLPLNVFEAPFSFEAGDIVTLSTGIAGGSKPDGIGIIGERYNAAGNPYVITVWGQGQHACEMDLLGRENIQVVGLFRMTHLFDYQ